MSGFINLKPHDFHLDRRRRVDLTIQKRRPDRFPRGELCIDDEVVGQLLGVKEVAFAHRVEFAIRLGLDLICLPAGYGCKERFCHLPEADAVQWKDLDRWCMETDFFVFVLLDGWFSWGMKLLGFQDFMTALVRQSPEINSLVREVEALNATLVGRAASTGAQGVVIADDIAYAGGLMVAPEILRQVFFPSLVRQVELARCAGLRTFFHSDGNIEPVLEDLAQSRLEGLQCIEAAAGMDLDTVLKKYGDRLCLWGNLDPALLTAPLNPEELASRVMALSASASRGGVIFGTSSGLFNGMRPQNIQFVYELLMP